MRRKKGGLFMTLGVLCLAAALCLTIYNVYEASRAEKISANAVTQLTEKITDVIEEREQDALESGEEGPPYYELFPDMEFPTMKIDEERYIGILYIPSLDLTLPIMGAPWSYAKLRNAPTLYSGSAYKNDMIIAGHNYRSHFSKIKSLKEGEEVHFMDVDGYIFSYQVGWVEILQPEDVEELENNEGWDLTLFTCTYGGNERFIVRCNLVE